MVARHDISPKRIVAEKAFGKYHLASAAGPDSTPSVSYTLAASTWNFRARSISAAAPAIPDPVTAAYSNSRTEHSTHVGQRYLSSATIPDADANAGRITRNRHGAERILDPDVVCYDRASADTGRGPAAAILHSKAAGSRLVGSSALAAARGAGSHALARSHADSGAERLLERGDGYLAALAAAAAAGTESGLVVGNALTRQRVLYGENRSAACHARSRRC